MPNHELEDEFRAALAEQQVTLMGQLRAPHLPHRFRCHACLNQWKQLLETVEEEVCPFCAKRKKSNSRTKLKYKRIEVNGSVLHVQGFEEHAIRWILAHNRKLKVHDLALDSTGKAPVIRYRIGRRMRGYYPDIFIEKANTIVEVKSDYTLGLVNGRHWAKNQQKAKAVLAAGYDFVVMVFNSKGDRLWIPDDWYELTRAQTLALIKENREVNDVPDEQNHRRRRGRYQNASRSRRRYGYGKRGSR